MRGSGHRRRERRPRRRSSGREYVVREGKVIQATDKGIALIGMGARPREGLP